MKYLKLFESIIDGFEEITKSEADLLRDRTIDIDKDTLIKISEYVDIKTSFLRGSFSNYTYNIIAYFNYAINSWMNNVVFIYSLEDEWCVTYIYNPHDEKLNKYYRCDQITGLISLIKTIIPTKVLESKNTQKPFIKISNITFNKSVFDTNFQNWIRGGLANEYRESWPAENWEEFSDNDINTIESMSNSFKCSKHVYYNGKIIICNINDIRFVIYKLKDEWFYVLKDKPSIALAKDNSNKRVAHYKCDQLDGLIDCLKKAGEINNLSESNLNDDYQFERIPWHGMQMMDTLKKNRVQKITEGELNMIRKYFEDSGDFIASASSIQRVDTSFNVPVTIFYTKKNFYISMYKIIDEWFYLKFDFSQAFQSKNQNQVQLSYKCDQIEGVIDCLKEVLS